MDPLLLKGFTHTHPQNPEGRPSYSLVEDMSQVGCRSFYTTFSKLNHSDSHVPLPRRVAGNSAYLYLGFCLQPFTEDSRKDLLLQLSQKLWKDCFPRPHCNHSLCIHDITGRHGPKHFYPTWDLTDILLKTGDRSA